MDGRLDFLIGQSVGFALFLILIIGACIGLRRHRQTRAVAERPDEPYRVYTRKFDRELHARDVVAILPTASGDRERGWQISNQSAWRDAAERVQPMVDARRDLLSTWPSRWRSALAGVGPADCAVALLIDQSGSMKGEPIEAAAATAQLIGSALADLGVATEILGFSTAGWHGGKASRQWQREGRPEYPGRLAALMHVVYKSADDAELSKEAKDVIVHPDLLRENIDGEALLWAKRRLVALPQKHKLLLVVSDGAPVDDATLANNGADYLWRHIQLVLKELSTDPALILGGVGIDYRVDELYPLSATVSEPADLPETTAEILERMFQEAARRPEPS